MRCVGENNDELSKCSKTQSTMRRRKEKRFAKDQRCLLGGGDILGENEVVCFCFYQVGKDFLGRKDSKITDA